MVAMRSVGMVGMVAMVAKDHTTEIGITSVRMIETVCNMDNRDNRATVNHRIKIHKGMYRLFAFFGLQGVAVEFPALIT